MCALWQGKGNAEVPKLFIIESPLTLNPKTLLMFGYKHDTYIYFKIYPNILYGEE